MRREPEQELMNTREQVMAYAKGDFSIGEKRFIEFINEFLRKREIILSSKDLIVDLGCGPGNITERLSKQWPNVNVLGIDGSKEMILKAKNNKNRNNTNCNSSRKLDYLCADIKQLKLTEITSNKKIRLLVSNSLIHHITDIDDFFSCLKRLSTRDTINFHKDLRRPKNKKIALDLKKECSKEYNEILTNDYYASLKASYRKEELEQIINQKELYSLDVIEESNQYLIVYGNV